MKRARVVRVGAPLALGLVVLLLALLVGALGRWVWLVAVAGLLVPVCEVLLHRVLVPAFPLQRATVLAELVARVPLELALLLVYVVRADRMSWPARAVVVVAVVVHQLLRMAHTGSGQVVERLGVPRAQARGLPGVRPLPRPATPLVGARGLELLVAATALPALGLLWAAATGSFALVAPAAVAMAAVAAVVVAAGAPGVLALLRRPRGPAVVASVQDAVLRHRPEVVFYSTGILRDLHWVTSWADTLDELGKRGRPGVVLVRDPEVFDALPPMETPVVCLPEDRDVRGFALPEAQVALFPVNSADNGMLLRRPGLRSAFIGHGDSDKAASARPTAKMYDEVWVAGEAGRERYLVADVGVLPERIRIVGRPQVRRIRRGTRPAPGARWTVLYAPTWEGIDDESAGSSLVHSGPEIVRQLLAAGDVRVLYRPHPLTGFSDYRYARADEEIRAALARAGAPHAMATSPTTDLATAFNEADLLIADVSAVVSDFLASGKPYVVVNGTDLDDATFRERLPSTAGALLVGRGAQGLSAALDDARGPDTTRVARERVRVRLIGPPTDDPVGLFAEAVDALASTLRRGATRAGGGAVAGVAGGAD